MFKRARRLVMATVAVAAMTVGLTPPAMGHTTNPVVGWHAQPRVSCYYDPQNGTERIWIYPRFSKISDNQTEWIGYRYWIARVGQDPNTGVLLGDPNQNDGWRFIKSDAGFTLPQLINLAEGWNLHETGDYLVWAQYIWWVSGLDTRWRVHDWIKTTTYTNGDGFSGVDTGSCDMKPKYVTIGGSFALRSARDRLAEAARATAPVSTDSTQMGNKSVAGRARPPTCLGETATGWGTSGDDQLVGGSGRDVMAGLGGDDSIVGLEGDDLLCGGHGDDVVEPGLGGDTVSGGGDVLDYLSYQFTETTGVTVRFATGVAEVQGDENDTFTGFNGVFGTDNRDRLLGKVGTQVFLPFGGNDVVRAAGGFDYVFYLFANGSVNVNLSIGEASGEGDDKLYGLEGVAGGDSQDDITGGQGYNVLLGLAGDDSLFGIGGDDHLDGGDGYDDCHDAVVFENCEGITGRVSVPKPPLQSEPAAPE